tara:strand:+ start:440 stop:796 length:357 start_codon:yes stop_codon:yes gene_type:complete
MKNIKSLFLLLLFVSGITSCGSSDTIVNIYGASEYNCTTDEYRLLKSNSMLPFLKTKKWYTRKEFHESYYEYTLEPFKDIPLSENTLAEIAPTIDLSNKMLDELITGVDCKNPKDLLY